MKKAATLLFLTQLLSSNIALASDPIAWIVATPGNRAITNFDVTEFVELTQISDAMKIALFKQAEGDFNKYEELKAKVANKYFKKSASQLIYAKMMKRDHKTKHGSKRVAFNTTEREYYDKVQGNEDKLLKDLLDQRMGIVKARAQYGDFLINSGYPHKKSESSSDVYWRYYEEQKARIKTEFLLHEVKKYESYISRKDERYYYMGPAKTQDFYYDTKKEVQSKIEGKKLTHKQLLGQIAANKKWNIVIENVSNAQLDTTPVKDLNREAVLATNASAALETLIANDWKRVTSYHTKASAFISKYKTQVKLEEKAKSYLDTYIKDKSNHTSYMLSLISKLAAKIVKNGNAAQLNSKASKLSSHLHTTIKDLSAKLSESKSKLTIEKEIEKVLYKSIDHSSLGEVEKALSELMIFSIKFQMKKTIAQKRIPVRVTYNKFATFKTQDAIKKFAKYEWMQEQYSKYINNELRWRFDYVTIRLAGNETLRGQAAQDFILGKRK
ncbi:hypothetical protein A9Q84_18260 [Halobacteriovorax marinus]|uniref:Uncharacterized protein n=1 Tax=Halobacteriovorax marinus TaxID=97084 RepID=A0A1Y5F3C2_9BACT|nr:hypothetical protein A9Q84_18260 [Halobacteriovorax marinus]